MTSKELLEGLQFTCGLNEILDDATQRRYVMLYQKALTLAGSDDITEDDFKVLAYKDLASEIILSTNHGLLAYNANKICKGRLNLFEDLIQEGRMGLLHAMKKFDSSYPNKFTTYANNWILDYMTKFYNNNCHDIRLPKKCQLVLGKATKVKNDLTQKLGHEPSIEEIAKAMKLTVKELLVLFDANKYSKSLDVEMSTKEGLKRINLIKEPENPRICYSKSVLNKELNDIVAKLDSVERVIIERRFGLNDTKIMTLEEIGNNLGYTKERIRQIEKKALAKLSMNKSLIECKNDYFKDAY